MDKHDWEGTVTSIQPRVRLERSFDERYFRRLGYVLRITGTLDDASGEFSIAIGKAAITRVPIEVGMVLSGKSAPVPDKRLETATFYKTSALRILAPAPERTGSPPPWHGVPPPAEAYKARGCRRLAARTYTTHCSTCIWGANMAVEIILDHWNPGRCRYRTETWCYGPLSCANYRPGPTRKVPGRKAGMTFEEEDWIDRDSTSHRGPDE